MKKIIVFIFLFVTVTVSAQNIPAEDSTDKPAITKIGKPDGVKTEMEIGKEGGSFTSSDGKLSLIIPEGAVLKKTIFSIQPTTNLAPNGNGKAYQMEPSGTRFQQPLQIVFNYNDNETEGSSPDLLGIAMQDEKGQWSSLKKATIDTVARTIKADILHFSAYVNYLKSKIDPSSAKVKVNGSLRLKITHIVEFSDGGDDDLMPLMPRHSVEIINPPLWTANGIPRGNSTTGLISVSQNYSAIYKAPEQIPAQNPVAVAVEFKGNSGNTLKSLKLVSNILVYDNAYEVSMYHRGVLGDVIYNDTGSFVVSLNGREATIIERRNNNTAAELNYNSKCLIKPLKPGPGSIDIAGIQSIHVIPSQSPNGSPSVEIQFIRTPTIFPLLQFDCPPTIRRGPRGITTNAIGNAMMTRAPAFPQYIKFPAIDEDQTQIIGQPGSPVFVKYVIKKLRE